MTQHSPTITLRRIIYLAVLIAIVWLLLHVQACHYENKIAKAQGEKRNPEQPATLDTLKKVKNYTDPNGNLHYVYEDKKPVGSIKQVVNAAPGDDPLLIRFKYIVDSMAHLICVKDKQIEGYMSIGSTVKYDNTPFLERKIDSLEGELQVASYYKGEYLTLTSRSGNLRDSNSKGSFDYTYKSVITAVPYWKRKKILGLSIGSKLHYMDLTSPDPHATINGVNKYSIRLPEQALGFHINARAAYSTITNSFSSGVGAQFDFGRNYLNIAYIYNWKEGRFRPVFTFAHDLIQF